MANFEELLSVNKMALEEQFVILLYKEELISEAVYFKALELLGKEKANGNNE